LSHSADTATSVTLLGRLAAGDASQVTWRRFVERYGPAVMGWCRRYGCPEADLEDVLQEVLLKLLKSFAVFQYDPKKRFRPWLSTVARNAVVDLLRSPQLRTRGTGATDVQRLIADVPAHDELGDVLHAEFQRELFEQACALVQIRIDPRTWQAFALTQLDELPAKDAAEKLAMPLAHLYVARSRVLNQLRHEVKRMERELDGDAHER
jgi:RNA polymerase sigma-70 factor (ECF subfamily)